MENLESLVHNGLNCFEKRSVNHHQLRSNNNGFYGNENQRLINFVNQLNEGNYSNLPEITDVVQIGIGVHFCPKAVYHACLNCALQQEDLVLRKAHFVANIDPMILN